LILGGSRKYFVPEIVVTDFVYFEDCPFNINFGLSFFSVFNSNLFAMSTYVVSSGAVEITSPSGIAGCPVTVPIKEYLIVPSSESCLSNDQSCIIGAICSLPRDDPPLLMRFLTMRGGLGSLKAKAVTTSTFRKEVLDRNEREYITATRE
jgi:hypothetical protein